jgi:hypothetical protein
LHSRFQGRLPTHTPAAHLEVGPIDEEVSYLFADGSVQPHRINSFLTRWFIRLTSAGLTSLPQSRWEIFPTFRVDIPRRNISETIREPQSNDDWIDPSILPPVACQESTIGSSRFPTSGQAQILKETEAGFEPPHPRSVSTVLAQRRTLVRFRADVSQEFILCVFLQPLSHEIPNPQLHVVQKMSEAFEPAWDI